jgi:hypothetical protein
MGLHPNFPQGETEQTEFKRSFIIAKEYPEKSLLNSVNSAAPCEFFYDIFS